jgi:hypothetical protein
MLELESRVDRGEGYAVPDADDFRWHGVETAVRCDHVTQQLFLDSASPSQPPSPKRPKLAATSAKAPPSTSRLRAARVLRTKGGVLADQVGLGKTLVWRDGGCTCVAKAIVLPRQLCG